LLRLRATDLGATLLESAIDVRLDELRLRHKRRPNQPTQIHLHDGTMLFVQLHMDQLVLPAAAPSSTDPLKSTPPDALSRLDTGDLRWRSAADKARRIVDKPISLLLQGESGVGKELFARATHDSGPRRDGPFVAINCSAMPENLIEAELFGYAPGAFTGARREGSPGRLREAHGGTLFLDEIGDMPLGMQTRLLRVLQERQVTPLGGARPVDVDFALICATHRKLREEADKGSFRSDLYYRINGLTVQLPALRERTDFQLLTERVLSSINPDRDIHLVPDLLARLSRYPWPGNMRQYASLLRTASAMLGPDEDCIDWQHLPDDMAEELTALPRRTLPSAAEGAPQNLEELSRSAIRQALENSRGNISQAARSLGISRQTLYRKINA
jgi:transcriptional regulator with PAS, ATPase and Fis domain